MPNLSPFIIHRSPFIVLLLFGCLGQKPLQNETYSSMIRASYPYEVKTAELSDDLKIAYMDEGGGPYTLLMVHGLGSYAPAWNRNMSAWKEHARCIALDLPGYGLSSKGDYPFTMTFFAESIEAFIRKLGLERVVLVGHSMGGQVSATVLLRGQVPVEKLVLVAPAGIETFTEQDRAWIGSVFTTEVIKASTDELLRRNFNVNFATNKLPDDAEFMFEDRMEMKADTQAYDQYARMIPKCVQGMLKEPVFDRLGEIDVPTLIIFGQEDYLIPNRFLHPQLTPRTIAETAREQISGSVLHVMTPCGHFVQWECPAMVNDAVLEFLNR